MTRFSGVRRRLERLEQYAAFTTQYAMDEPPTTAPPLERRAWKHPNPGGTWRIIEWEPWMPPWPQIQALLAEIEESFWGIHRPGKEPPRPLEELRAEYNTMLTRRPTPWPPLQHTTPQPQEPPPRPQNGGG